MTTTLTRSEQHVSPTDEAAGRQRRLAAIRAELAEVAADERMAARLDAETTRTWRAELRAERRDCWESLAHLAGA